MTDLRKAAQQALAFTMRDFATMRDFEAARAVLHDDLRAALADQPQTTHWQGCEEVHPECAAKTWSELEQKYQAGCDHCNHPLYAGVRCGACGRWTEKP
jgi:hypothetical protein